MNEIGSVIQDACQDLTCPVSPWMRSENLGFTPAKRLSAFACDQQPDLPVPNVSGAAARAGALAVLAGVRRGGFQVFVPVGMAYGHRH